MKYDLREIGEEFQVPGAFVSAIPYGSGYINDTFAVSYNHRGKRARYIHQRINSYVFKEPERVMDNILRVTEHLQRKLRDSSFAGGAQQCLRLVLAEDGRCYHCDPEGNFWRTYRFIEGARTYDIVDTPDLAVEAAKQFGRFITMLADLPGERLHETIPHFHDTSKRFRAFEVALEEDVLDRVDVCRTEVDFALRRRDITSVLEDLRDRGEMPERIVHNDTKVNNVMIDEITGVGLCVVDLDTVMPGLGVCDFGDLVRTSTSPALEDEIDLSKVSLRMEMFHALVKGFHRTAGDFLTPVEVAHLSFSGKLIAFELGLRFLTDYLDGDHYFKIDRPEHNLDRCRTQFRMVELMEQQDLAMEKVVAGVFS